MQYSILFVVHAGEGIGLGHLTRCVIAARSLILRLDAQVNFVAVGQNIDHKLVKDCEICFSATDEPTHVAIDQLTRTNHYAAICLDLFSPFLSESLGAVLENIRKTGCKIVAIDSLSGLNWLVDLLYIPSFMRALNSEDFKFNGRIAYGWDAYLLNVQPKDLTPDRLESVLVLTGGSDVTQLGQDWPAVLNRYLPHRSLVHWVTGPFSKRPLFPDSSNIEFIEHIAPDGLDALMHRATAAVTVFGVSFFELIAIGVPTVVFSPYGEKDSSTLQGIAKAGIALVAKDAIDATKKVALLINDSDLRAELTKNARNKLRKFDGEYFAREIRLLLAD